MKTLTTTALFVLSSVAVSGALAHNHGSHAAHAVHAAAPAQSINDAPVSTTLSVSDCWIRAIPAPAPSGGFFIIRNSGPSDVKLVAAASPSYRMVMLHQTTHSQGMSRMAEVHDVVVPAGKSLAFKPGDYHAMLEGAAPDVKVGADITLNLLFDNGQKAVVSCEVMPANTRGR